MTSLQNSSSLHRLQNLPKNFQHAAKSNNPSHTAVLFNHPYIIHTVGDRLNHHRHQWTPPLAHYRLCTSHHPPPVGGSPAIGDGGRRWILIGRGGGIRRISTVRANHHHEFLEISLLQPRPHETSNLLRWPTTVNVGHEVTSWECQHRSSCSLAAAGQGGRRNLPNQGALIVNYCHRGLVDDGGGNGSEGWQCRGMVFHGQEFVAYDAEGVDGEGRNGGE